MTTATNPRQNVTFPSGGSEAHGYLALPASGSGPGVIVIQEWWGLTDHIAGIADRLAAEGFVALAPDLFGGSTAHDADEAGKLMAALPPEQGAKDLLGAVDYLKALPAVTGEQVGAVGFCMGGGFVLSLAGLAGDAIAAAVPFYGVGGGTANLDGITAAIQGHYGENDAFYAASAARELESELKGKGLDVDFHFYDAGHAFHNDENHLGTYDEEAAKTAWARTVAFLHAKVG